LSEYEVIWDGRRSLHDVFLVPGDVLLWRTRGHVLTDWAPGGDLPTRKEAYPEQNHQNQSDKAKAKRAKAKARGNCVRCCVRRAMPGRACCTQCRDRR
jgi:hypothetical protein